MRGPGRSPSLLAVVAVTLGLAVAGGRAWAQAGAAASAPVTAADLARVERELRDQRAIIMQMLKVEQERYDLLLKLITSGGQGTTAAQLPALPALPAVPGPAASVAAPGAAAAAAGADSAGPGATVTGKIIGHGDLTNVYVFVDGLKAPRGHGKAMEIGQKDKQFVPQSAVVVAGTRVSFPNYDAMYHNVFSPSRPKPFDLGTYRQGDPPPSVVLSTPGVVEVFCNIHAKMSAKILVVPNQLYARVRADGTFHLERVPQGKRKIAVWGPDFKPARQDVEVTASGAEVTFSLDGDTARPHKNKSGLPYKSYE